MSSKLFNPLENPPNPSSSDEEYEEEAEEIIGKSSSEEEEEETDSEPETERKEPVKNPVPSVAKKNQDSKKRASETDASSDAVSGEENSSSEEEEETDSEPEIETKEPVKNPVPSVVKKNQDSKKVESSANKKRANETNASKDAKRVKTVSEEASSEEEEEETDSEPVKNHGPSVGKKNQESKKVKSSATKKRASDEADASTKDAKRVKTASGEETKKNYFQRVWSEEDEIAVLQGIIDYNIETGASPYDDTSLFYELVKKSISFDVSKTQFMEKIRSLKKKFENNLGKRKKKNGEDPAFSKPHDRKAFDLSKLVWGDNGIMALDSSAVKSNGKSRKSKKEELLSSSSPKLESMKEQEFVSIVESVARFGVDGLAAQQGWNRLASEDKKRFEEQWKALQIKEFKFFSQKSGFIHQVVTKMAEAFRPNP